MCRIGCDNMFNMEKKINRRENNEGRRQEGRSFSRNTRNSGYKSENKESSQTNRRYLTGREKTMKINLVLIIQGRREVLGRSLNPVINADRE